MGRNYRGRGGMRNNNSESRHHPYGQQNQQSQPPHTPRQQKKQVTFQNNNFSRRNSQGNDDPPQKTPNGNNYEMRDSDSNSSNNRNNSSNHSKTNRFDRRKEEAILAIAESSGATLEEINFALIGQKELKRLNDDNDVHHSLRLLLCSNCRALSSTVKELESRISGLKSYQWNFRGPLTAVPASPLATPAALTTPLPVDMESPVDYYLETIATAVKNKDRQTMATAFTTDLLRLPTNWRDFYNRLNSQLNDRFPKEGEKDERLLNLCKKYLTKKDTGDIWKHFITFVKDYLLFVRDFKTTETDSLQNEAGTKLTMSAVVAFGDAAQGALLLDVVLNLARNLSQVAVAVHRDPTLFKDGPPRQKPRDFVEQSANTLRDAFIKCLADSQTTSTSRTTRPAETDKRFGIYVTANACLKVLFASQKLRNAQQVFLSIDAQSPALSLYPAAQRVTYLYYLGRYHFANSHLHRAFMCLESAYLQCHRQAVKHRQQILIYLIASAIPLGRFPSARFLSHPELSSLAEHFFPLCKAIRTGDLGSFYATFDLKTSETARWFLRRRILLQLRNRCEILVWRSLIRVVFEVAGFHGGDKKVPFVHLNLVRRAAIWAIGRSSITNGETAPMTTDTTKSTLPFSFGSSSAPAAPTPFMFGSSTTSQLQSPSSSMFSFSNSANTAPSFSFGTPNNITTTSKTSTAAPSFSFSVGSSTNDTNNANNINNANSTNNTSSSTTITASPSNPYDSTYTDPDFHDLALAISETGFDPATGQYFDDNEDTPPSIKNTTTSPTSDSSSQRPTLPEIESLTHSLLSQSLLRGFTTHSTINARYAIPGATDLGWKMRGFPPVWETIDREMRSQYLESDETGQSGSDGVVLVPGWVREESLRSMAKGTAGMGAAAAGGMGGRVVNLSGIARPVGSGMS